MPTEQFSRQVLLSELEIKELSKEKTPVQKMPSYIGTKVVCAEKMNQEAFLRSQNKWQENQETMGDGYLVVYEDGYKSWSPKSVFERCYRPITDAEKRLI